jgi:hydroxymethylglutaryl-CoA lyase
MGVRTGVDFEALVDTGAWISERLGRPNGSRAARAAMARRSAARAMAGAPGADPAAAARPGA